MPVLDLVCSSLLRILLSVDSSPIFYPSAIRMEDMVLKGFDKKKERLTAGEVLGDSFARIGNELGSGTPHGE